MFLHFATLTSQGSWALVLLLGSAAAVRAETPVIEYDARAASVVVRGLPVKELRKWQTQPPDDWSNILAVFVGSATTPLLGTHSVDDSRLRFAPRFQFEPGLKYRVRLRLATGQPVTKAIIVPKDATPATTVAQVYPTTDHLPENQLKFYLHFSAPMRRGEAYEHVLLLDHKGTVVERPFLELGEELWDPTGQRFTLFLHPGRIKRGLKPREELGPPLEEGKRYTLVIGRGWSDSHGNPLASDYRKSFMVGKPDAVQPDPKLWKLSLPKAGSQATLVVRFPEALDHALLQRMLWVVDQTGKRVAGTIQAAKSEYEWHFRPAQPWQAGRYRLIVDTALEDLAGNSVGRPFEVDEFKKIDKRIEAETVELLFEVR